MKDADGTLDKESTSYNDIFDTFRLGYAVELREQRARDIETEMLLY